jgi:hypothetical protein
MLQVLLYALTAVLLVAFTCSAIVIAASCRRFFGIRAEDDRAAWRVFTRFAAVVAGARHDEYQLIAEVALDEVGVPRNAEQADELWDCVTSLAFESQSDWMRAERRQQWER